MTKLIDVNEGSNPSQIVIAGGSGFLGSHLSSALAGNGFRVMRLSRTQASAGGSSLFWNPAKRILDISELEGVSAIINLAGESIASGRWSADRKERIWSSRVEATRLLAESIQKMNSPPKVFLTASAIGYYGDRGDTDLTEDSPAGEDFLGRLCKEWETVALEAQSSRTRVVCLRTGIVLSEKGGPLVQMIPPFKLGLGGVMGSGRQWMSWIALQDWIGAVRFLLDQEGASGSHNLTAPNPVTNRQFTVTLGRVMRRPTLFTVPELVLKLAMGEMAEALLLTGQKVNPHRLLAAGFRFQYPLLEEALRSMLPKATGG